VRFSRAFELTLLELYNKSFVVLFSQFFVVKTSRVLVVNIIFFDLQIYELSLELLRDFENNFRFKILFLISNRKYKVLFIRYVSATRASLVLKI